MIVDVAVLGTIEFPPLFGGVGEPWADDPGIDAFVKAARSVSELFGEALRDMDPNLRIANKSAAVVFLTVRHGDPSYRPPRPDPDPTRVLVEVRTDPTQGGAEGATVWLPEGVEELSGLARARLVTDVICGALEELAPVRGWRPEAIRAARRRVVENRYTYRYVSKWKTSPSRKYRARCAFDIDGGGTAHLRLEFARRDSDDVVAARGPFVSFPTREGFIRSARTFRWVSLTHVSVVPRIDTLGGGSTEIRIGVEGDSSTPPEETGHGVPGPGSGQTAAPGLEVRAVGSRAPNQPQQIILAGGGPINDTEPSYVDTLFRRLSEMEQPAWQQWWSAADATTLFIYFRFRGDKPDVRIVVRGDTATASIYRAPVHQSADVGEEQAIDDVDTLVAKLRARFGLGEPPTWSSRW